MFYRFLFFSFIFFLDTSLARTPVVPLLPDAEISILSYNTFLLPKIAKKTKQDLRAKYIGDWLKAQDFDIILLQEVFSSRYYKILNKTLKTKYPYNSDLPERKWYKPINSGLVIFSKYPISNLHFHFYKHMKHADKYSSKGVQVATIKVTPFSKIRVFNTHLQAHDEHFNVRKNQLSKINSIIKREKKRHEHLVVAGDFNIHKQSTEYDYFREVLGYNEGPIIGEILHSYDGHYNDYVSFNNQKTLDYIFLKSTNAHIYHREYHNPKARIYSYDYHSLSDHLPIEARIFLP